MKAQVLLILACLALSNGFPNKKKDVYPFNPIAGSILIVGGEPAAPNEIPYQVTLNLDTFGHWCGGSILTPNHIVTAAHCFNQFPFTRFTVHAGEHNLAENDGTEQVIKIAELIVHELYGNGNGTSANDIAILRLATPLVFSEAVQPIALPAPGHLSTGIFQTSGWGALLPGGTGPDVLHKVQVPYVEDAQCEEWYDETDHTVNGAIMICAGLTEGGKDSCQGDSGGPLTAFDNGVYLAGIVSWGEGCARPRRPGIYVEVMPYLDWINAIIN